jgi:hypothetical protein
MKFTLNDLINKIEELGGVKVRPGEPQIDHAEFEALVAQIEASYRARLPSSYVGLLAHYGQIWFANHLMGFFEDNPTGFPNGYDVFGVSALFGIHDGKVLSVLEKMRQWSQVAAEEPELPQLLLPILDDLMGNWFLLDLSPKRYGSVYFWDHEVPEGNGLRRIAPSFEEFIMHLEIDPGYQ